MALGHVAKLIRNAFLDHFLELVDAFHAKFFGKRLIDIGGLRLFNLGDLHVELGGLAGQVLNTIFRREGYLDGLFIARLSRQPTALQSPG